MIVNLITGLGGALIGSLTVVYVQRKASSELEKDELRKKKIDIIHRLIGSRYVLSENYTPAPEEVLHFNTAMAHLGVYFAGERTVRTAYDRFREFKTNENLVSLLSAAAKSVEFDLLDSTLNNVLTVSARSHSFTLIAPQNKKSPPEVSEMK